MTSIQSSAFRTPSITYHGFGALNQLGAELNLSAQSNKRVMILCDINCRSLGFLHDIENLLDPSIQTDVCSDIVAEPTEELIHQLVTRMHLFNPDVIIAMGGGSVMDAAKVCCLVYHIDPTQDRPLESLYATESVNKLLIGRSPRGRDGIRQFICIPTTSGTGSEMTPFAFIRDLTTNEPKRMIASLDMMPDITVVDAFFTTKLPTDVVAQTGFDVLVKALESLTSPVSNDSSQSMSIQAARLIFKHLTPSVSTGRSEHRAAVHDAASIVGMAMANTLVGAAHAIGAALQASFLRRGKTMRQAVANSIVLIEVMKFNAQDQRALDLYAELSVALGFSDSASTQKESFDRLINAINQLRHQLCLPLTIHDAGLSKDQFEGQFNDIVQSAMKIISNFARNARLLNDKDVEAILKASF